MSDNEPTASDPVRLISRSATSSLKPSATLRQVAESMIAEDTTVVVVSRTDGTPALLTERDIIGALASGSDPDDDWAVDVMTSDLKTLDDTAAIRDAAQLMRDHHIRHVVVRNGGETVTMICVRDILDPLLRSLDGE